MVAIAFAALVVVSALLGVKIINAFYKSDHAGLIVLGGAAVLCGLITVHDDAIRYTFGFACVAAAIIQHRRLYPLQVR
jgi:hypothetical protein